MTVNNHLNGDFMGGRSLEQGILCPKGKPQYHNTFFNIKYFLGGNKSLLASYLPCEISLVGYACNFNVGNQSRRNYFPVAQLQLGFEN